MYSCSSLFPCRRRALYGELHECVFYIGNKPIEFVNSFCDLGNVINFYLSDDEDITERRNNVIGQVIGQQAFP